MVKQTIYIRVAKTSLGRYKAAAATKPTSDPIWDSSNYRTKKALPTVKFAIEVDIPEERFASELDVVAKINLEHQKEVVITDTVNAL